MLKGACFLSVYVEHNVWHRLPLTILKTMNQDARRQWEAL
jgi:hypothetical protein